VFEAAMAQGLVWRYDEEWAVFNSGMPRGVHDNTNMNVTVRFSAGAAG
jgi:hypothetical protein